MKKIVSSFALIYLMCTMLISCNEIEDSSTSTPKESEPEENPYVPDDEDRIEPDPKPEEHPYVPDDEDRIEPDPEPPKEEFNESKVSTPTPDSFIGSTITPSDEVNIDLIRYRKLPINFVYAFKYDYYKNGNLRVVAEPNCGIDLEDKQVAYPNQSITQYEGIEVDNPFQEFIDNRIDVVGILTDGDKVRINNYLNGLKKLPDSILMILLNEGYRIRFVSSLINFDDYCTDYVYGGFVKGCKGITVYSSRSIVVSADNDKVQTLIHEVGHAIDRHFYYLYGRFLSRTDYFMNAYHSEDYSWIFPKGTYFMQNGQEFFAQNFAYYYYLNLPMDLDGPNSKKVFDTFNKADWDFIIDESGEVIYG